MQTFKGGSVVLFYYQTLLLYGSLKDLLCLTELSFHWFWQIFIFTGYELNLVQDRSTSHFCLIVGNLTQESDKIASMIS